MAFITYENRRNPHVTIHTTGCREIGKNGGQHKYGQGGYEDHISYSEAREYAESTGLRLIVCSKCKPLAGKPWLEASIRGRMPEEVAETPALFEGAVSRVLVNAYERNSESRQRCIELHGTICCICGFSFGDMYGEIA